MFKEDRNNIDPMVSRTFTSKEQVRLVPDILQNSDAMVLPWDILNIIENHSDKD